MLQENRGPDIRFAFVCGAPIRPQTEFTTGTVRQIADIQKPFAVTDSGFAVSPNRRYMLYTQIDQSGSDINILDR